MGRTLAYPPGINHFIHLNLKFVLGIFFTQELLKHYWLELKSVKNGFFKQVLSQLGFWWPPREYALCVVFHTLSAGTSIPPRENGRLQILNTLDTHCQPAMVDGRWCQLGDQCLMYMKMKIDGPKNTYTI
mgnify:FL=1